MVYRCMGVLWLVYRGIVCGGMVYSGMGIKDTLCGCPSIHRPRRPSAQSLFPIGQFPKIRDSLLPGGLLLWGVCGIGKLDVSV